MANAVAFFDIGNTLATVRVSAVGDRIQDLAVLPGVTAALQQLRQEGVRLGILSDRGRIPEENVNDALERASLLTFFDRDLILYGPKDSPRLFEQAAMRVFSGIPGNGTRPVLLFVGENGAEREQAEATGFRVVSHPSLAPDVLREHGGG